MDSEEKITKSNWFDPAWFLSKWLFTWLVPLHNIGLKREITFDDLCRCCKFDEPLNCAERLDREWNKELEKRDKSKGKKYKPNLIKAIIRANWLQYFWCMQIPFWGEIVIRLAQPFMVGMIVRYLSQVVITPQSSFGNNSSFDNGSIADPIVPTTTNGIFVGYISSEQAIYVVLLLIVSNVVFAFSRHPCLIYSLRIAINIRTALTVMLYEKILIISKSSLGQTDTGQMLNIMSNDLNRFDDLGWHLPYLFIAPPMAVIVVYASYIYLGVACVGGLVILILFIPFQGLMGRLFNRFRRRTTKLTDTRVRVMGEIISAMKLIKLYCWEAPFAENVAEIREQEVKAIRQSMYLTSINTAMYFVASRMMLFASFIVYVLSGNPLDAETVFVMMSLFNAIRVPVTSFFPNAIGAVAEALVSCNRVEKILLYDERQERIETSDLPKGSVSFKQYSGKWSKAVLVNFTEVY